MDKRTIVSSGRIVFTIEDPDVFWVFRKSWGYEVSVSGPFKSDDSRFSDTH